MLLAFEVFTVFLTAIAMGLALAHALEYPGKLRLDEQTYRAVQAIYYPGFTIGGIAEPVAAIAVLVLLLLDRRAQFSWLLAAFLALAAMHAVFWFVTQPVNRYWLKDQKLSEAGAKLFDTGQINAPDRGGTGVPDWRSFRKSLGVFTYRACDPVCNCVYRYHRIYRDALSSELIAGFLGS